MKKLEDARLEIDIIDKQMIELFAKRMQITNDIASIKIAQGLAVHNAEREKEVIERAGQRVPNALKSCAMSFMATITRISRGVQYSKMIGSGWELGSSLASAKKQLTNIKSVAYQGIIGSYSYQAATQLFADVDKVALSSFPLACEALAKGEVDIAVLPLENSTAGTVNDVYDYILKHGLYIVQALSVNIKHSLSVVKGAGEQDIKSVMSHPQALAQCAEYIRSKGWTAIECDNTALAASEVAKRGDKSIAAISSSEAALQYGLEVLQENIADNQCNTTRFVVLSKDMIILPDANRISVAFKLPHESGSLSGVLAGFADYGLNLAKVQSRPVVDAPWEYYFYLDFMSDKDRDITLTALCRLERETPFMQFLGWYSEEFV